jgi:hypothetical protein
MPDTERQAAAESRPFFGVRKAAPRACVVDTRCLQNFLADALEEIGFVSCRYGDSTSLSGLLAEFRPDVFVVGLSGGGVPAAQLLQDLAANGFAGQILIMGPPAFPVAKAVEEYGVELGLNMLPLLPTPFSDRTLHSRLAGLLSDEPPPTPTIDVAEALHLNQFELWYQPKIMTQDLSLCGAEALIRLRHPAWGCAAGSFPS